MTQLKSAGFDGSPELFRSDTTSDILIACSGGVDSLAMAHLICRYGRRIVSSSRITLLHIDHALRPESAREAKKVAAFAKQWGVRSEIVRLDPKTLNKGESVEAWARTARKAVFRSLTGRGALILTAHQQNDLAETVLWRLLTGQWTRSPAGILPNDSGIVRPLLGITREELTAYLAAEGLKPVLDPMNDHPTLLRTRLRQEAFPALQAIFPRAVEHLAALALQSRDSSHLSKGRALGLGPQLRAAQWEEATKQFEQWKWKKRAAKSMALQLTEGWVLEWESKPKSKLPREASRITVKRT